MIQIGQTEDDLPAKGLLVLRAHTSGLHAAGMPRRYIPPYPANRAKIIGERNGDNA
jgi:hypothetical protein